jgi:hypothetical protein
MILQDRRTDGSFIFDIYFGKDDCIRINKSEYDRLVEFINGLPIKEEQTEFRAIRI